MHNKGVFSVQSQSFMTHMHIIGRDCYILWDVGQPSAASTHSSALWCSRWPTATKNKSKKLRVTLSEILVCHGVNDAVGAGTQVSNGNGKYVDTSGPRSIDIKQSHDRIRYPKYAEHNPNSKNRLQQAHIRGFDSRAYRGIPAFLYIFQLFLGGSRKHQDTNICVRQKCKRNRWQE